MRRLLKSLGIFLIFPIASFAQSPPQIPLTGNIGVQGSVAVLGGTTVQMPSDANYTLTPAQWSNKTLIVTSAVSLSATRNIVAPLNKGQEFNVENNTTGGQSIVVIGASGTGITIANGTSITVFSDGTNYLPTGSNGSSSVGAVGTPQVAASGGAFAAGTVANMFKLLSSLYLAPNYMFGDSTTFDWGADLYENSYAGLLANSHGGPSFNKGVLGALSTDGVVLIANTLNPNLNTAIPQYVGTMNFGINDGAGCGGTNSLCQQNFTSAESAGIALFELTGSAYQKLATACSLTGTWTSDTTNFTNAYTGKVSTTNGDTLSCAITTTGNPIAIEAVVHNADAGTANCRVDSGTYQNINFFPNIAISNGLISIFRTEIAAGAGSHTLNCVITSPTLSTNPVEFISVDSFPVGQTTTLPYLTVTNVTPNVGVNDANSAAINALVAPIVTAFQAEGGNLVLADIRTPMLVPAYFSTVTAGCPQLFAGTVHYNDCGHRVVYNAIQQASPSIYQTNVGQRSYGESSSPIRSVGRYIPSSTLGSGFSSGNSQNLGAVSGNLAPGAWCIFANECLSQGSANGQIIPPYTGAIDVVRINGTHTICLSFITSATVTESSFNLYPACWNNAGDYYTYFANGGTPIIGPIHPGFISHDNVSSVSGTTGPSFLTRNELYYVGPLTANVNAVMGQCNPGSANLANYQRTLIRHGNDGFVVNFPSTSPDNINGGAAGNTYVWSAGEGNRLDVYCSQTSLGGTSWSFVATGTSVTPILNSFTGSGTATYTIGATAQVGTSPGAVACAAGYSCDSIGGRLSFATGTGTLAAGTILTITTGITRSTNPSCIATVDSLTYIGLSSPSNATTISINVLNALTPSTTYIIAWECHGN